MIKKKEKKREQEEWMLFEIGKRGNLLFRHLERNKRELNFSALFCISAALVSAVPICMFSSDYIIRWISTRQRVRTFILGTRK